MPPAIINISADPARIETSSGNFYAIQKKGGISVPQSQANRKRIALLKKGQKGIFHAIFSRFGLIVLLLLVQVAALLGVFIWLQRFLPQYFGGAAIVRIIIMLYFVNKNMSGSARTTWLIISMALPFFGISLYLFNQSNLGHRLLEKYAKAVIEETKELIPQDEAAEKQLEETDKGAFSLSRYMKRSGCHPVYKNTSVTYFPLGEDKFKELLIQLEQAESFIFLEYFILDEGVMWGEILEILARKATQGVDVRLMYDGTCELALLPLDYPKRIEGLGIKCKVFAPIKPFVSTHYNYRDHRKILVIDGHTAFTGGINLADEYINQKPRFGHWKDTAVMLKGDAAKSFTLMFLQLWDMEQPKELRDREYLTYLNCDTKPEADAKGFVIPYGDCPLDSDLLGERVYMDILNRSTKYVHIMTPYLILDEEMENTLKFTAERGVDVSLILPGIPDKYIPYALAKTHYKSLLQSGVKIYEYTPGFVHAKVFVSDGREGVVGTVNLDYRSFYHHFECGCYMYGSEAIPDLEKDFRLTAAKCRRVTLETVKNEKPMMKIVGKAAKVIAPLM
ncbi:MAG: cardiolipin synthase [Firmicutes bacterium]|nr:cardiolipin synthase [[Eubacterium] siraeum]MCM1487284.1 cardiolipin synthase [Bacillota bacterium]